MPPLQQEFSARSNKVTQNPAGSNLYVCSHPQEIGGKPCVSYSMCLTQLKATSLQASKRKGSGSATKKVLGQRMGRGSPGFSRLWTLKEMSTGNGREIGVRLRAGKKERDTRKREKAGRATSL